MGAAQLLRLMRLVGRDEFQARTGASEGAGELDEEQRRRLSALIDERLDEMVKELIEEAAASDDVTDAASALDYAANSLAFLEDLLSDDQRSRIIAAFKQTADRWRTA